MYDLNDRILIGSIKFHQITPICIFLIYLLIFLFPEDHSILVITGLVQHYDISLYNHLELDFRLSYDGFAMYFCIILTMHFFKRDPTRAIVYKNSLHDTYIKTFIFKTKILSHFKQNMNIQFFSL